MERHNGDTQLVTLIGTRPGNLSSAMHNAAYECLGVNFRYVPLVFVNLLDALRIILTEPCYKGASVTMPFKEEMLKYIGISSEHALIIGAVNTIIKEKTIYQKKALYNIFKENGIDTKIKGEKGWHYALAGHNTDYIGAIGALREETELEGKTVVLTGAGGAGKALAYGLKQSKANVIVFNRTPKRAKDLAERFGLEAGRSLEEIADVKYYDILINATSVGAYPDVNESIVDETVLKKGKIVMDIVSKPLETKLLKMAQDRGCRIIPGYKMLVYQAMPQVELFIGRKVTREVTRDVKIVMERAVLEALK